MKETLGPVYAIIVAPLLFIILCTMWNERGSRSRREKKKEKVSVVRLQYSKEDNRKALIKIILVLLAVPGLAFLSWLFTVYWRYTG